MVYAVTGATGQLGRLVIDELLKSVSPQDIVATVRTPSKAGDLASKGVQVREADYEKPETLRAALGGVDRLLLISSSQVGRRAPQHRAVIEAAKAAGVGFVAYTSVLFADRSPLGLAEEHRQTEAMLKESGIPHAVLRNGWYTENNLMGLQPAIEHGAILGSSGEGRIASASRKDYAEAAAVVLTGAGHEGKVYELAGDNAWSVSELAAEVSRQSGKPVVYKDMPQTDYKAVLLQIGIPEPFAELISDSSACTAKGALEDTGRTLSRLIGHPTTPMPETVAAALKAL